MRISDWSSDVCSSDLRCVVESYPDERKYEREDGSMAGEDAQRDNDVTTGAVTKVTDSPVGPTVGAMPVRGRATGGRVTAPGRVASAEERSEEHTSELQSLMRISYAVFCLKKKKKQKTTY